MTPIDRLQRVVDAATPKPWEARPSVLSLGRTRQGSAHGPLLMGSDADRRADADARFIATSRGVIDDLLAVARAAQRSREILLERLLHGDERHRQWLIDEVAFIFAPYDRAREALDKAIVRELGDAE